MSILTPQASRPFFVFNDEQLQEMQQRFTALKTGQQETTAPVSSNLYNTRENEKGVFYINTAKDPNVQEMQKRGTALKSGFTKT